MADDAIGHDRNEAILTAVGEIQKAIEPGESVDLVACVGPPECNHVGVPLPPNCPRCTRMVVENELPRA